MTSLYSVLHNIPITTCGQVLIPNRITKIDVKYNNLSKYQDKTNEELNLSKKYQKLAYILYINYNTYAIMMLYLAKIMSFARINIGRFYENPNHCACV